MLKHKLVSPSEFCKRADLSLAKQSMSYWYYCVFPSTGYFTCFSAEAEAVAFILKHKCTFSLNLHPPIFF